MNELLFLVMVFSLNRPSQQRQRQQRQPFLYILLGFKNLFVISAIIHTLQEVQWSSLFLFFMC